MKKTLLALAAIAASSAAFAQSSLTVYGVADVSVESVKGDNTVTRVSSSNLTTSRLGFKGAEDLGDGMKAIFNLETGVNFDTGAQAQPASSTSTGRFWDRQAWVGLAGGFGDLRLGRTDSSIADIAANVLGSAQNYDDLKIAQTRAAYNYRFVDNAITYRLPTLVSGLDVQLQYTTAASGYPAAPAGGAIDRTATGAETAGTDAGKAFGLNVKYAAGPFAAGIGYLNAKDENTAVANPGNQKANATLVYVGYDFGVAKVTGFLDTETKLVNTIANGQTRAQVHGVKVAVPFSPTFRLITSLSQARNTTGPAVTTDDAHDNATIVTVRGIYDLSKRTSAYVMAANVRNSSNSTLGISGGPALTQPGKDTHGVALGLRHSF